jgi:hypothetical protein
LSLIRRGGVLSGAAAFITKGREAVSLYLSDVIIRVFLFLAFSSELRNMKIWIRMALCS